jgi:hypothetical protein
MISDLPSSARSRATCRALRPLRKSIQTLLSTTITRLLALCGYTQDCRAGVFAESGIDFLLPPQADQQAKRLFHRLLFSVWPDTF